MARSHLPDMTRSSQLLCTLCFHGLLEQHHQKNGKAVSKKRKMRINSSLEFKFFSMEIIFDDFFKDVLSGCFCLFTGGKEGKRTKREVILLPKQCYFYA